MPAKADRTCARVGCEKTLAGLRSDALFCSDPCRREATRVGGPESAKAASQARGFWKRYAALRKRRSPSRGPLLALATGVILALPIADAGSHSRIAKWRCPRRFTVRMDERAAQAIYRGTRTVTHRNLRLLGRLEMCQRNPRAQAFVRSFNRRQAALHDQRVYEAAHPLLGPATASWFDDSGETACGFHATLAFATLNGTPCGGRITFYHDGQEVTAVREDSGPYVSGREFDLNPGLRAALHCSDLCSVTWRTG